LTERFVSLLHRPKECAILQQPSGVELRPIFDNQHSAVSAQHSAKQFATLCRPDSKNGKRRRKLGPIRPLKNAKEGLRPLGHRSVELRFDVCFQQSAMGGGVYG
jgi:hypothetical protein